MADRLRGRRGMVQRARRLRAEPLCRDCLAKGRISAAYTPDHVVPLAHGGTDADDNIRCLCRACHAERTAQQFGYVATQELDADGWPINNEASIDKIKTKNIFRKK